MAHVGFRFLLREKPMHKGLKKILATTAATAVLLVGLGGAAASAEGGLPSAQDDNGKFCKKFDIHGATVADVCFWWVDNVTNGHHAVSYQFNKLPWGGYLPSGHWVEASSPEGGTKRLAPFPVKMLIDADVWYVMDVRACNSAGCGGAIRIPW